MEIIFCGTCCWQEDKNAEEVKIYCESGIKCRFGAASAYDTVIEHDFWEQRDHEEKNRF
ncbi:MAG: hypothetical protein Q4C96_02510 [Planctomycetia bacterium]|nr:hypothetical protein [Planctomycetia bacterium]